MFATDVEFAGATAGYQANVSLVLDEFSMHERCLAELNHTKRLLVCTFRRKGSKC